MSGTSKGATQQVLNSKLKSIQKMFQIPFDVNNLKMF